MSKNQKSTRRPYFPKRKGLKANEVTERDLTRANALIDVVEEPEFNIQQLAIAILEYLPGVLDQPGAHKLTLNQCVAIAAEAAKEEFARNNHKYRAWQFNCAKKTVITSIEYGAMVNKRQMYRSVAEKLMNDIVKKRVADHEQNKSTRGNRTHAPATRLQALPQSAAERGQPRTTRHHSSKWSRRKGRTAA